MLYWYVPDESHVLLHDLVELDDQMAFIEESVAILAKDVKKLQSRVVPMVKDQWNIV